MYLVNDLRVARLCRAYLRYAFQKAPINEEQTGMLYIRYLFHLA